MTELTSAAVHPDDPDQRGRPLRSRSCRCSALLADEVGPLGHLDVGASGGLNLLLDQYEYRYGDKPSDEAVATVSRRRRPVGRWCSR